LIVDLDELDLGELLEIRHKRARDRVERPIGLAAPGKINVYDAIRKGDFVITREAIKHKAKPLVALDVTGTFEIFIEHRADEVLRRGYKTRHCDLIRELTTNEAIVVCEVDIHFHEERRARGRGSPGNRGRIAWGPRRRWCG